MIGTRLDNLQSNRNKRPFIISVKERLQMAVTSSLLTDLNRLPTVPHASSNELIKNETYNLSLGRTPTNIVSAV